jgi:hypothetical protein
MMVSVRQGAFDRTIPVKAVPRTTARNPEVITK